MNLQGRDLKLDLSGGNVRLLHNELRQLGYIIPNVKLQEAYIGSLTSEVVVEVQQQQRL